MKPRILKGFRDYLPKEMIPRKRMVATISEVFESFGFSPLDTPSLEYSEVLLGKYGQDVEKLLYRFQDNGKRDICLRYDLTVPLARFMGMHRNLQKPFKRYQIGNVWRAESPSRGRFREFSQCDADIIGTQSLTADAECLAAGYTAMKRLEVEVSILLNHRKILRGLQEKLGIEDLLLMNSILRILDKILKIGKDGVRKELSLDLSLPSHVVDQVISFSEIKGKHKEVFTELENLFVESEIGQEGIRELKIILEQAQLLGLPAETIEITPAIARGLDYYTGAVFETFMNDLPDLGSVMSGGRYDTLTGTYSDQATPAVGISIGLDRLLAGLLELQKIESNEVVSNVLVTIFSQSLQNYALEITSLLRSQNLKAEVYLDPVAKFRKQMKYADSLKIPFVVIAGPEEQELRSATLRNMISGEQTTLPLEQIPALIKSELARAPKPPSSSSDIDEEL